MPPSEHQTTFLGTPPRPGTAGLLVTSTELSPSLLVKELSTGGPVESLGVLVNGEWRIYLDGAPAAVNRDFPKVLSPLTAFFVRMRNGRGAKAA